MIRFERAAGYFIRYLPAIVYLGYDKARNAEGGLTPAEYARRNREHGNARVVRAYHDLQTSEELIILGRVGLSPKVPEKRREVARVTLDETILANVYDNNREFFLREGIPTLDLEAIQARVYGMPVKDYLGEFWAILEFTPLLSIINQELTDTSMYIASTDVGIIQVDSF